jgi:hypothetical protein
MPCGMVHRENGGFGLCRRRGPGVFRSVRVSFIRPRTVRFVQGAGDLGSVRRIEVRRPVTGLDSVRLKVDQPRSTVAV